MADRPLAAVDALLSDDAAAFGSYCATQDAADWPDYRVLDAMLIVAARQRWPEHDLDGLVRFARTVPDRIPDFLELPQLFAEALLRTALGESGLLVGIPASYDFVWQLGLIAALAFGPEVMGSAFLGGGAAPLSCTVPSAVCTTVPSGTGSTMSSPSAPLRLLPCPGFPDVARRCGA